MKYHLGCGPEILPEYTNVDLQPFPGVDLVTDLEMPELEECDEVFSNAFFEHLSIDRRASHLETVYDALAPGGIMNYMGLPYFPGICEAYMNKLPGTMGDGSTFDLYHAYRYTHGAPDESNNYMAQLHKGLFDLEEFERLIEFVNPDGVALYTYVYPGEPKKVRVTSGMFLSKGEFLWDSDAISKEYLSKWDGKYIDLSTVEFM